MSTYKEEVGSKLNDLLEKTYDAEKGFKKAAENVDHRGLKNFFNRKAAERCEFSKELKSELQSFGEIPEKDGTIAGNAHRVWMDIKSALSLDDEESMLEEAIRGEKSAVEEYCEVLEDTSLPSSTRSVLSRQKDTIQSSLSTIKRLEDIND